MRSYTRKPAIQRDLVSFPVKCAEICNDAEKHARELGQTIITCHKNSGFSVSFAECNNCAVLATGDGVPEREEFHLILNYCASVNSPIFTGVTKIPRAEPSSSGIQSAPSSSPLVTSTTAISSQMTSTPKASAASPQPGNSQAKVVLIACVIIVPMLLIIIAIAIFLSIKTRQGTKPLRKKHTNMTKENHEDKAQLHSESSHKFELPLTLARVPELMGWWRELFELRTRERIQELPVERVVYELPAVEPVGSELPANSANLDEKAGL